MTPQEIETLFPFLLIVLVFVALTALCGAAAFAVFLWGRKQERRTWRYHEVLGGLLGSMFIFYAGSAVFAESAASRLGREAEWTAPVFIGYAVELAIALFIFYLFVKNLRLAIKGYYLEKDKKSENS